MKNYVVIALRDFDDYEGAEVKPENHKEKRFLNKPFNCTKERYEYLLSKGAVRLVGIDKIEEPKEVVKEEVKDIIKEVKPKTTKKNKK